MAYLGPKPCMPLILTLLIGRIGGTLYARGESRGRLIDQSPNPNPVASHFSINDDELHSMCSSLTTQPLDSNVCK